MKKDKYLLLIILFLLISCDKNNRMLLNNGMSILYFDTPKINLGSQSLNLDSIDFSFAFEDDNLTEKIIAIPINLIGTTSSQVREIDFEVDHFNTTLNSSNYHISSTNIQANEISDTLFVEIHRNSELKNDVYKLTINLTENKTFKVWSPMKSSITLYITDQLLEPSWWKDWDAYFGAYHKEVYGKWIKIYAPGLDPSSPLEPFQKPNFGWNNMPFTPSEYDYPITFFYIDMLKAYFEQNVVYPNDDHSKTRIKLP